MLSRITQVREKLKKLDIDAFFVTSQPNVSYLTGFAGLSPNEREGFLLVSRNNSHLFTFPTYFQLYCQGGGGFKTLEITQTVRLKDHLTTIIGKEKIRTIGYESENLTVAELESLKKKTAVSWRKTHKVVEDLRIIKDKTEIAKIKKAALVTDQAFDFIKTKIRKGVTEKELALELEFFLKKTAGDIAFSPIVAFNKNAAIPHYLPTNPSTSLRTKSQRLTTNSLILMDFGAKYEGYCADMTRIIFFGKPLEKHLKTYRVVLKAQMKVLKETKNYQSSCHCDPDGNREKQSRDATVIPTGSPRPDVTSGLAMTGDTLDCIARDYIKSHGFVPYPHGLGHGVGLSIHEDPRLKIGSKDILREGMVFTVEPGIYLPGQYGIRIEDLVLLKKDGIEILSKTTKEITILE